MEDEYGFMKIGQKIGERLSLGNDHRKEYVSAKKEHYRAIVNLSDRIETLTDIDYSLLEEKLAAVGYTMQSLITVLSSQAPSEGEFNPFNNAAEQLTTGMTEWSKNIDINTEAYMTSLNIPNDKITMYGVDCFVNSLLNTANPDIILSVYLSLVNYLTKFEVTNITQINKSIIELV